MGKNTGSGGRSFRKGKKNRDDHLKNHEMVFKDDCMGYGYVEKTLGNGRFMVVCEDMQKRLAHIRGNMRKKVWIGGGDMILYSIRDFQADKIDIIHKYTNDDVSKLYRYEEITKIMYDSYTHGANHNSTTEQDLNVVFSTDFREETVEADEDELAKWTRVESASEMKDLIDEI
jgi:translation initiation factor 1A